MVVFSIFCLILVIYVARFIIKTLRYIIRTANVAANIPGPKPLPIIGNTLLIYRLRSPKEGFGFITGLFKEYSLSPGLVKLWFGPRLVVFVMNPKYIETVLTSTETLYKDGFYGFIGLVGNGLFVRNGQRWEELRKPLNKLLTKKMIESNINMFHEKSLKLCKVLKKYSNTKESLNFRHYSTNFALDTLCVSNFGHDLNELEKDNRNIFEHMERIVDEMTKVLINIIHYFYFPWVNYSRSGRNVQKLSAYLWKLSCEILKSRIETRKELGEETDGQPTFYSDVVIQKAKDYKLSWEETGKFATDFLVAGFDTSAVTTSYIILMLAMFPEHQEAVYQEQLDILGENPEMAPTWEQLSKMVYLTRVVKEVMRLYCPPSILRHVRNDLDLGQDYKLPKGCTVLISFYSLHRNPTFWSQPEKFYPDHFLPEECAKRPKNAYYPFSWGPRSCPGSVYAMIANKTLISTLIREYKFETDLTFENLDYKYSLLVEVSQGFMVRVKPRK
ncbi:cytochrome P450 4C1-like isoform X2 [Rhodnius prolixus]